MPAELVGIVGVRPEGADGAAAVHVIGGAIEHGAFTATRRSVRSTS